MMDAIGALLLERLDLACGSPPATWLAEARARLAGSAATGPIDSLWGLSAATARHLGDGALTTGAEESLALPDGATLPLRAWSRADAGRAILMIDAGAATRDRAAERVRALYRNGDLAERISVCRALPVLGPWSPAADPPAPLMDVLRDALRTNAVPLFDAASADAPAFTRWLPEREFDINVLKRVYLTLPLGRVWALESRANPELSRMLEEFAIGAMLARRGYPTELWAVVARHPTPGLAARLVGMLEDPRDDDRRDAARALAILSDPAVVPGVRDRLARESHPEVRAALEAILDPGA